MTDCMHATYFLVVVVQRLARIWGWGHDYAGYLSCISFGHPSKIGYGAQKLALHVPGRAVA